jgi:predicted DsbA family dithiol-disulfide isomerase
MKTINLASLKSLLIVILVLPFSAVTETTAQTEDTVVAVVNGREIKQREVDEFLISQVMALEEQLYAIRKASLENLVSTVLLEAEAEKRGLSSKELRKILTAAGVEVKPAEVETAYAENAAAFGAMSPDEAKERLRLDLETQARMEKYRQALKELRQQATVKFFLREPRWPWLAIADNSPVLGAKNGAVTIVEFADFQCPYCRSSQKVIKELLKAYPDDVRLIFKHLPLDTHSPAFTAARAAFCAGKEGRFWEYHDSIFALRKLGTDDLRKAAGELKLSLTEFDACLTSDASREAITQNRREAARWGITSTPTFMVNGKIIQGATDLDVFKNLIEQELTSAQARSRLANSNLQNARRKK